MSNPNPDVGWNLTDALTELIVMLSGNEPSSQQLAIFIKSLSEHPPEHVRDAFRETIEEDERFVFARLVKRIRAMDGRPTAEAMWLEINVDESKTIWRTDDAVVAMPQERTAALSVAIEYNDRQQIAQIREAFKADYNEAVAVARKQKQPVRWSESPGFDKDHRKVRAVEAVRLGRITRERVSVLLPSVLEDLPTSDKFASIASEVFNSVPAGSK